MRSHLDSWLVLNYNQSIAAQIKTETNVPETLYSSPYQSTAIAKEKSQTLTLGSALPAKPAKNGKRYTYYRLMKAVYPPATEDNPNPSRKTKMVEYLGTKDSAAYKEMKAEIARRNEIQRLERKLIA